MSERILSSQKLNKTSDQKLLNLWTANDVVSATGGELRLGVDASGDPAQICCHRVHTDSRATLSGDLFIPIKGPKIDGHEYIVEAFEGGAVLALCEREYFMANQDKLMSSSLILVEDAMEALNELAHYARQRSEAVIFAVTGSYGKTSMKDGLALCLSQLGPTHKTQRSFNNHWGLPLTLANLHPKHDFAVIEMGMNGAGEISQYSHMTKPHVAMITNTGDAHIGKLGSLQAIADAKAEVFEGLVNHNSRQGFPKAVLWSENWASAAQMDMLAKKGIDVVTFGESAHFSVQSTLVDCGVNTNVKDGKETTSASVTVPIFSTKWGLNVGAITACVSLVSESWENVICALEDIEIPQGRGNIIDTESGVTIIDESYNAAPGSMAQALGTLATLKKTTGRRVIAVLGEMLELGDDAKALHVDLSKTNRFSTIDKVYVSGEMMAHLFNILPSDQQGLSSEAPDVIANQIQQDMLPGDIILVKGSRGQWAARGRMSVVVDSLVSLEKGQVQNQEGALC